MERAKEFTQFGVIPDFCERNQAGADPIHLIRTTESIFDAVKHVEPNARRSTAAG
jgi:hypothetical protein